MIWTAEQEDVLDGVGKWLKERKTQVLYVAGYAGTGKSTLIKHFTDSLKGDVFFAAYTGKAAKVMRSKGCDGATTIHRLIYQANGKSEKRLQELAEKLKIEKAAPKEEQDFDVINQLHEEISHERKPSFNLNEDSDIRGAELLVLDECSMVSEQLARDIMYFKTPILVLGDPAQLPPIHGSGYFTNRKPDFLLTQIHRQAAGSEVLRLATMVRNGEPVPHEFVVMQPELKKTDLLSCSQILTGKNVTRRKINNFVRKHLGRTGKYPVDGDRLVCLKNDHEQGLLNGDLLTNIGGHIIDEGDLVMSVRDDDTGNAFGLISISEKFDQYEDEHALDTRGFWDRKGITELDYAYALTVHKAQGSQWKDIILFDDGFGRRSQKQRQQWLYTAITRAEEKVTIVRGF